MIDNVRFQIYDFSNHEYTIKKYSCGAGGSLTYVTTHP